MLDTGYHARRHAERMRDPDYRAGYEAVKELFDAFVAALDATAAHPAQREPDADEAGYVPDGSCELCGVADDPTTVERHADGWGGVAICDACW